MQKHASLQYHYGYRVTLTTQVHIYKILLHHYHSNNKNFAVNLLLLLFYLFPTKQLLGVINKG